MKCGGSLWIIHRRNDSCTHHKRPRCWISRPMGFEEDLPPRCQAERELMRLKEHGRGTIPSADSGCKVLGYTGEEISQRFKDVKSVKCK